MKKKLQFPKKASIFMPKGSPGRLQSPEIHRSLVAFSENVSEVESRGKQPSGKGHKGKIKDGES